MQIEELISASSLKKEIRRLAKEIRKDYRDKNPLIVGCLNGCFVFMADLIRLLDIELSCDFIKLSSYRNEMTAGELKLLLDVTIPVENRDVIICEDIVDTGKSLIFTYERLKQKGAKSISSCVLLYKQSPRCLFPKEKVDYLGFAIPDKFVVGYGIDCAQKFRELPYVGAVRK